MKNEIKMFSIAHKEVLCNLPEGSWIELFAIGELAEIRANSQYRDNCDGESISKLHPYFSELTAHYWVWKNLEKVPLIGFCHYRRYFNFLDNPQINLPQLFAAPSPELMQFLNQESQKEIALKILETSDVIATRSYCLPQTIHTQFCQSHPDYIWKEFIRAISTTSPAWIIKYLPWFELSREFRFYPIFITRWEIFDEFCSLLFDVLFEVFKNIGALKSEEDIRFPSRRYPAYLSERFMMLYFHAKGLRVHGAQLFSLEL
jgi:hypothetical protein